MKDSYAERCIGLLGEDIYNFIKDKRIAVFGLGGVGGTALECLVRTGFSHLFIVDFDTVSESNLNRQILYIKKDIGTKKVDAAKERIMSISDDIEIDALDMKVNESISRVLREKEIDFIVDAIDDVEAKAYLAKYACDNNIPIVVSLGMANRLDPTKVEIIRLNKTTNDPLAKKVRYVFKSHGIDTRNIMSVISKETPKKDGVKLNSIMCVPSSAGLAIAYYILSYFKNMKEGL